MTYSIKEITNLYPVEVENIYTPSDIASIVQIVKTEKRKISIGGGRYSMGGQTGIHGGVQIDMRSMNRVLEFLPEKKLITVETGIRWRDIQQYIDPYDLSIMTMQTYSNFTVGGSLSVNVHGRYIGYGPLILSVLSIKIILANGDIVEASREKNSDIFSAAIGGYGGIGIIVEATLHLKDNTMLERVYEDMPTDQYGSWFRENIRDNQDVIFHNADIYPPHYTRLRATSWKNTDLPATTHDRMIPEGKKYQFHQMVYRTMTDTKGFLTKYDYGKWVRENLIDKLTYAKKEVHTRNYEASYDVAELEPKSREENTYVLEEYFCPVEAINAFVPIMKEIFQQHDVNVINVSIRHALPDDSSLLAWAKEEVFAFVVYYNQKTTVSARREVAVWTRELIDAVISLGGRYYLPYQLHGTLSQVKAAYTGWEEFAQMKKKYDPEGKFSNMLLEKYYFETPKEPKVLPSRFCTVYDTEIWRDGFYMFLQNIFHIAPTDIFHSNIWDITQEYTTDKEIYKKIQDSLHHIKPLLADIRYGIPALLKQKNEMARQSQELLGKKKKSYRGYLEIGGAGRYIKPMSQAINIEGPIYLLSDEPIDYSPVRILERGKIAQYHTRSLSYTPEDLDNIPDNSLELITIFIGLHHSPLERLDAFIGGFSQKLKKGGSLLLRDHNVTDPLMHTFVSIAHDIYNAGTGAPWESNENELRHFRSLSDWKIRLANNGLISTEKEMLQQNDPTDNTLMHFLKQ